jgi:hypothetical protein
MDIYPEDFWMTFNESSAPQPGWLATHEAVAACRATAPPGHAPAQRRRKAQTKPVQDCNGSAAGQADADADVPAFVERRKKKPATRTSFAPRMEHAGVIKRPDGKSPAKVVQVRLAPLQGAGGFPQAGSVTANNVVELRPRARDHTYADFVLSALRSMFEAQAAGQKELLKVRIKLVSHLLEDIGRRRAK